MEKTTVEKLSTANGIKVNIMSYNGRGGRAKVWTYKLFPLDQSGQAEEWAKRMTSTRRGYWYDIKTPKPVVDASSALGELIERLKVETEPLRVAYIEKSREWAVGEFGRNETFVAKYRAERNEWKARLGGSFSSEWGKVERAYARAARIVESGLDKYIAEVERDAELHYAASTEKLAHRVIDKGLDLVSLKVVTGHVARNIEVILSDASGARVRAFTILAWGAIVRPHYRYLIK